MTGLNNKTLRWAIFAFVMMVSASLTANAQIKNDFSYENENFAGVDLNYRMAVINPDTLKPEIIVIYLHGGSGQGNDNVAQLQSQAVSDISDFLRTAGYHARILAPQAPEGHQWNDELIAALKALSDKYNISGNAQCYILGGSMGGYGVWNMLTAYPGYFAGAMPVACNTPKIAPENYTATRIYSVAGGNDRNRNLSAIQTFFNQLEAIDGEGARLDIEEDWNHRQTCEQSFTPQRLAWLLNPHP